MIKERRERSNKPWERQKGESEKAFEAFKIYRDMGEERTITAVGKRLVKSRNLIDRWKERWRWKERARSYDNELEKQAKAKAVKEYHAMTERHIKIAVQLQKKALEALNNLESETMSAKDIKEFIKMATDLERLNRTIDNGNEKENMILDDGFIEALKQQTKKLNWEDRDDTE